MSGILGAAGAGLPVRLAGGTFNNLLGTPPTYAGYKVDNDGYEYRSTSDGSLSWTQLTTWLLAGSASTYYVKADHTGDALEAGSSDTGSFLQLTSDRSWYLEAVAGAKSCTLTISLSNSATGLPVLATATVTLNADITV